MATYTLKRVQSWDEIFQDFQPGTELFQEINNLFAENHPVILVQSELLKRWLQLRFSEMGWVFLPNWQYPSSFFKKIWQETEIQTEHLLENSELPFFALKYAKFKDYATAQQASEILIKYTENFPEILEEWSKDTEKALKPEEVVEHLWRACLDEGRYPLGWHLWKLSQNTFRTEGFSAVSKIIILGSSFLSVVDQKFLLALSQSLPVVHYLLEPRFKPEGTSVHRLTLDLLRDQPGVEIQGPPSKSTDREIRLTACWGERRELEVALDDICHLLNQEPNLQLQDIGLVSLDWAKYRLYLNALLDPASPEDDRASVKANQEINFSNSSLLGGPVLTYQLEEPSPVWENCFSLLRIWLELSLETWTRSKITHYLNHFWIKTHLELDQTDDWEAWCEQTQFRWGNDVAEVEKLSPRVEVHASLEEAWGRFVQSLTADETFIPIPNWYQVKHFAIIKAHLDLLDEKLVKGIEDGRTWGQWAKVFHDLVEEVIQTHYSLYEEAGGQFFISKVFSLFEVPQAYVDLPCTAKDFADFLLPKLRIDGFRPQLLVQGLSLGNPERFRGIPFDTLVLLGMNEDFPRQDVISPYDVIFTEKERWEKLLPRARALGKFNRDMTLFYDTVSQAKKRIWIYYSGFALTKDELKRPSPLVEEFVRKIEHHRVNSVIKMTKTSIYHFERYYEGDTEKTFYKNYADVGQKLSQTKKIEDEWTPEPYRRYSQQKTRLLSPSEIFSTCKYPLSSYLKFQLDFYAPWFTQGDEENSDIEEWDGEANQYLNLLLSECVGEKLFDLSEATDILLNQYKHKLESGAFGKWREKSEGLAGSMKEAYELYETVHTKYHDYSVMHTYFSDNYYLFTNKGSSVLVVVPDLHPDNLRYDQLITLLWIFSHINANGLNFPSEIFSINSDKKSEIPNTTFFQKNFATFDIFSDIAPFYLKEPFMVPFEQNYSLDPTKKNRKTDKPVEFYYQSLLSQIDEPNEMKQRYRYELIYLIQGKRLPKYPPKWFQEQYKSWVEIMRKLLGG